MFADDDDTEGPLKQTVAGVVTALTFLVGFGLLAAGVPYFWITFPVGFGGVLPAALGGVQLYQRQQSTESDEQDDEDPIDTLRRRYAEGKITEAEFEQQIEQLLETEPKTNHDRARLDREVELE
jgi:uncharacterized membrane protein